MVLSYFLSTLPKSNKSRYFCQANTNKKESQISLELFCGAYGTRTRDPMRDRHVF